MQEHAARLTADAFAPAARADDRQLVPLVGNLAQQDPAQGEDLHRPLGLPGCARASRFTRRRHAIQRTRPRRWSFVSRLSSVLMLGASLVAGSVEPAFARGGGRMGGGGGARDGRHGRGTPSSANRTVATGDTATPAARPAAQQRPAGATGAAANRANRPATHSGRTTTSTTGAPTSTSTGAGRQHPAQHRRAGADTGYGRAPRTRMAAAATTRITVRLSPLPGVRLRRRVLSVRRVRRDDGRDGDRGERGERQYYYKPASGTCQPAAATTS